MSISCATYAFLETWFVVVKHPVHEIRGLPLRQLIAPDSLGPLVVLSLCGGARSERTERRTDGDPSGDVRVARVVAAITKTAGLPLRGSGRENTAAVHPNWLVLPSPVRFAMRP